MLRLEGPPLLTWEIALASPVSSENDGLGFAIANAIEFTRERMAVLETANDRVVLFDTGLRAVSRFGREGSGPGELRDPIDLAYRNHEYAITELNNTRVSVFDSSGQYVRSFGIPHGYSNVGLAPDGTIYVNAYDGRNYLLAANREGTLRPFGDRPLHLYPPEELLRPGSFTSGYIHFAVTDSGAVIVYDAIVAALIEFTPDGRQVGMHHLPRRLTEALTRQSSLLARDFGGSGKGAPAGITDLSLATDGRLLLLFPNVGAIGLVVNLSDWTAREIRWGPGLNPKYGGAGGVLRGDTLYRHSSDDLRLFRLAP